MYRSIRKKDDETEGVNEIHEFWDGKITSAMEAEWRSLGYSMFQSFPPVKAMHIHCGQEQPAGEDDEEFDGCSEFTKYLHRPTELDALLAPSVGQDMPTALDYFERVTVFTVPPAPVRAAVGRASGSVNDVLHIASWPVQRSSGSPIFYSTINNRPYYYYLRKSDDRCVVRAQHARYRTEQWYLRLIAMKVPIEPFHATNNPDPLQKLLTVTKDGTSTVHTTYQETARALGIISNDNEGELALIEACSYATPEALLSLFTQVTINGQPTLRILCGLGLDLTTPTQRTPSNREPGSDDDPCDDRTSPFDVEAESGDDEDDDDGADSEVANSGGEVADSDGEVADSDSTDDDDDAEDAPNTNEHSTDQQWQLDAARNPDLERVRNTLLGRYRGSRPERVHLFLLDLKASFEANNACPTSYGIPLPPDRGAGPVAKEIARWKHDPAIELFNQSHSPRGRQAGVVDEVDKHLSLASGECETFKMVYVDGKAGTGKTTTLRYILNKARLRGLVTLVAAPTNLAALLYSGGQSCHALFELLVTRDRGEVVTSRIRSKSDKAQLLQAASIIVIDELPSMKRADFEAMLQLLDEVRCVLLQLAFHNLPPWGQNLPPNHRLSRFEQVGFRGILVAAGDFRQIGPVVRDANSVQQIQASPRLSQAWPYFKQIHLDAPQRTRDDTEYDAHVTKLGDGASAVVGFTPGDSRPVVDVSFIKNRFDRTSRPDALNFTFDSDSDPSKCAVLAPTNVLVDAWNLAVQVRRATQSLMRMPSTVTLSPISAWRSRK